MINSTATATVTTATKIIESASASRRELSQESKQIIMARFAKRAGYTVEIGDNGEILILSNTGHYFDWQPIDNLYDLRAFVRENA